MPYPNPDHIKSPLKRARDTGAAGSGTHEWWEGRATAVMLMPLALWLFISFVMMAKNGFGYDETLIWLKKPYHAFPLLLFVLVHFYHCSIAAKDVIIDYIPDHMWQMIGLLALRIFCFTLMLLSLFSVLYITFKL